MHAGICGRVMLVPLTAVGAATVDAVQQLAFSTYRSLQIMNSQAADVSAYGKLLTCSMRVSQAVINFRLSMEALSSWALCCRSAFSSFPASVTAWQ